MGVIEISSFQGGAQGAPGTHLKMLISQPKRARNMLSNPLRVSVKENCRKL